MGVVLTWGVKQGNDVCKSAQLFIFASRVLIPPVRFLGTVPFTCDRYGNATVKFCPLGYESLVRKSRPAIDFFSDVKSKPLGLRAVDGW